MARPKISATEIKARVGYKKFTVLLNENSRRLIKIAAAIRDEKDYQALQWLIETYLPSWIKENTPE